MRCYCDELKPFTHNKINLQKNDLIYISSDGFQDQFGGKSSNGKFGEGKKFGRKKLKELLLSINEKPMTEQKEILDKTIEDWKGNLEQVDDILIMGLRV